MATTTNHSTRQQIRAAISNAYYDARNTGRTMEAAADAATDAVVAIIEDIAGVTR